MNHQNYIEQLGEKNAGTLKDITFIFRDYLPQYCSLNRNQLR